MSLTCTGKKLRDEVHPKALLKAKQVTFVQEVRVKEFLKETCIGDSVETKRRSSDSSLDISSSVEDLDSKEYFSQDDDLGYATTEDCLEEDSKSMDTESLKVKFSFKQPKRKRKKKLKLKSSQRRRSILIVGDMACGKTSLMTAYCKDKFSDMYTPTILHCWESDAKVSGRTIPLQLVDVPGRYDYKPIRCAIYKNVDVAIVCYSAGDVESFEHIRTHWLPELKECAPKCPIVLAETKRDIRDEFEDARKSLDGKMRSERKIGRDIVSQEAGPTLAKEVGAQGFYSCSAKFRIGTRSLLQEATLVALKKSRKKRTS